MLVPSALWALLLSQLLTSTFAQVRFTHRTEWSPQTSAPRWRWWHLPNLHVTLSSFCFPPHELSVAVFTYGALRLRAGALFFALFHEVG